MKKYIYFWLCRAVKFFIVFFTKNRSIKRNEESIVDSGEMIVTETIADMIRTEGLKDVK
ncbi:hypothetical protein LCGC14_0405350 [marine sediment metagenome]|uniref:Uncharacterized protein n=1 Tax=marine sediment metagenome TaxID=412755 RepID=A0A0F9VHI5_9ZZZZ